MQRNIYIYISVKNSAQAELNSAYVTAFSDAATSDRTN